jgi:hypothetical protein
VWVTSNTQAGLMLTTFGVPSLLPITGATILMPFCPLRTTRPAFSQAWKPRTSLASKCCARMRS